MYVRLYVLLSTGPRAIIILNDRVQAKLKFFFYENYRRERIITQNRPGGLTGEIAVDNCKYNYNNINCSSFVENLKATTNMFLMNFGAGRKKNYDLEKFNVYNGRAY